jgi:hypothetical protein
MIEHPTSGPVASRFFRRALAGGAFFVLTALGAACGAPAAERDDDAVAEIDAELDSGRPFLCGYALPGYNCDNGRRSTPISAANLATAVAACPSARPAGYTDSCYVLAADGGISSDPGECSSAAGSWRPGNSCCNLKGTKSCPVTRRYLCGYALPGYGCNNGRRSSFVNAADLTAALAACPSAQPAGYTDFCYVLDADGGTAADVVDCGEASGSWRPGNGGCNFNGTLSCPQ